MSTPYLVHDAMKNRKLGVRSSELFHSVASLFHEIEANVVI